MKNIKCCLCGRDYTQYHANYKGSPLVAGRVCGICYRNIQFMNNSLKNENVSSYKIVRTYVEYRLAIKELKEKEFEITDSLPYFNVYVNSKTKEMIVLYIV